MKCAPGGQPHYVEEILTLFALARLSGARGVFILAGLTTLRLIIMAPREERELRAHTGAADEDYARRVPPVFPR